MALAFLKASSNDPPLFFEEIRAADDTAIPAAAVPANLGNVIFSGTFLEAAVAAELGPAFGLGFAFVIAFGFGLGFGLGFTTPPAALAL